MKKIAIIKKKEVLLGLLAIFFMLVGFFSYNPIIKKEYSRIADIQNYSESSLGEATLVSSNDVIEEDATTDTTTENPSEEIETSAAVKKYASDNNIELNREDYKIIKIFKKWRVAKKLLFFFVYILKKWKKYQLRIIPKKGKIKGDIFNE